MTPGPLLAGALLLAALARPLAAAELVMFDVGATDGPRIAFSIDRSSTPRQLLLRTAQAGVAGSRLTVTVDKARSPVFDHVFTADECRFPDGGASTCEVVIGPGDDRYEALVEAFRRGLLARVVVEDAGVMKMDYSISLIGFTRALNG